jgi:hypothetical protein
MAEQVGLDLARVEQRLGNFVLQMIGFEQEITRLREENAALVARLAALEAPKGPQGIVA